MGANHLPFQGRLQTDQPDQLHQPDQLREGSFEADHLIPPPGWPYTEIRSYATEETGDDDGLEEKLREHYKSIKPPIMSDAINDIEIGTDKPDRGKISGFAYVRDPKIRAEVLRRAAGKCEFCGELGFMCADGNVIWNLIT